MALPTWTQFLPPTMQTLTIGQCGRLVTTIAKRNDMLTISHTLRKQYTRFESVHLAEMLGKPDNSSISLSPNSLASENSSILSHDWETQTPIINLDDFDTITLDKELAPEYYLAEYIDNGE